MRSLSTYYSILRKKGFYTCMRELKKAVWPVWWTHSKVAIEQIQAERASKYLWRKYGKMIAAPLTEHGVEKPNKTIWLCWLQGMEQAPDIVKQCVASVKHYMPEYRLQVLTAENIAQFVELPEHIWAKYKNGTITFTHFSDILRTALLVQHGGIWLDATVLLTGTLPTKWTEADLFFLQKSVLNATPHAGSSWMLAARKGNPVLQRVLELLGEYWRKENKLRDYYLFHLLLFLVLTKNEQGQKALHSVPYISNVDAHVLQFRLFEEYSDSAWRYITESSPIHKLTWKFNHNEPLDKKGTYYDYILHHLHL